MVKFSRAQISLEIIILIIFLILFLYIFNDLSQDTSKSLEITKVKAQQKEIILSLNEFFKLQEDFLGQSTDKYNIVNLESTYKIPSISIPSKPIDCKIIATEDNLEIISNYGAEEIISSFEIEYLSNRFIFPSVIYCGQTITCEKNNYEIECT